MLELVTLVSSLLYYALECSCILARVQRWGLLPRTYWVLVKVWLLHGSEFLYLLVKQEYRRDLKEYPQNGWSLLGLAQSLKAQGKFADADAMLKTNFTRAWKHADIQISSSCPTFAMA